jgi:hypothetical protein
MELMWVEFSSKFFADKRDVESGRSHKVGNIPLQNAGFILRSWYGSSPYKIGENSELYGIGLRTAWSEDDFAAVSSEENEQADLRTIFIEIHKLNAVICFGSSNGPFENPGLIIAIADRIPMLAVENWYKFDKDQHEIKQVVLASGIETQLATAGKRYYALSPRRQDDGSLKFWLNPQDQHLNNSGWFTLEQLRLWAVDEGPIPMKKKESLVN